jgi:hypothetical protein
LVRPEYLWLVDIGRFGAKVRACENFPWRSP